MSPTSKKGTVIVYDPVTQTMSEEKLENLGKPVISLLTRRWQSHVTIYADVRSTEPEPDRRLVAALNLDKLGWSTKLKRLFGQRIQIYVMERPRPGGSSEL